MSDNLVEQLEKLSKMHDTGMLSDEEFSQAKSKLLDSESAALQDDASADPNGHFKFESPERGRASSSHFQQFSSDDDIGRAANRWVSLQTVMAIVGVILFCIMGLFMCSKMNAHDSKFEKKWNDFPTMPTSPE